MADLIAFLHSGQGAKAGAAPAHPGMGGMGNGMHTSSGKSVFLSAGCGSCHTDVAAGTKATVGPNLDQSLRGKSAAYIQVSIVKPNAAIAAGYSPGIMPMTYGSQLSKQQIAALVAFLHA
jgi:mono/diheme cytochrome c family protein